MTDAVWLGLIVAAFGALTTWLTLRQPERMAKLAASLNAETIKAAEDRADKVKAQGEEVARLLKESNETVAKAALHTSARLDEVVENGKAIHTLVNSDKTAGIQRELDQAHILLALMIEVVDLKKTAKKKTSAPSLAAIESTRKHIGELEKELGARLAATKAVERQQKKAA